jgi:hypothetical protein
VAGAALSFGGIVGIVSIIGVILTAIGLWIAWRYRQRPTPSAPSERRKELAEDAATKLTDTRAVIDGIWVGLLQHRRAYFKYDEANAAKQRLREAGEDLDRRRARLRVAFGTDSEVAEAFNTAADAVVEIHRTLNMIRDLHSDPPISGDEHAQREVDEYFDADRDKVGEERERYGDATERFEVAAGRVR